eukprot:gene5432-10896_t
MTQTQKHFVTVAFFGTKYVQKCSQQNNSTMATTIATKATCLCIVYVSDGLRGEVIQRLRWTGSNKDNCILAHYFQDSTYNRTSFYLLGPKNVDVALDLCSEAISSIDFSAHSGTHPTLGVVDHVCFFPLGTATLSDAKNSALSFSSQLSTRHNIPIFLYGEASINKIKLKEIRKSLGYFDNTFNSQKSLITPIPPDIGPNAINDKIGISCVGAIPFVQNFNMKFANISEKSNVAKITKHIREDAVEALTLQHEVGSYEVACNLLQPSIKGPQYVLDRAQQRAAELNLEIDSYYTTGPSEQDLLDMIDNNMK